MSMNFNVGSQKYVTCSDLYCACGISARTHFFLSHPEEFTQTYDNQKFNYCVGYDLIQFTVIIYYMYLF